MWSVVVCFDWRSGRLFVWSRSAEVSFDDPRIAVTPFTLDRVHSVDRTQIDHCVGFTGWDRGRCFRGGCVGQITNDTGANGRKQQYQADKSERRQTRIHLLPPLIAVSTVSAAGFAMSSSSCG